jgi:formiminotetrahydrofolate cyclodeaminase
MPLEGFTRSLASSSPSPGGGAAAAVAGALGASLVAMACRLTLGRKKYAAAEERMQSVIGQADSLQDRLLQLADEDAEAFADLMAVYDLKDEAEQKRLLPQRLTRACDVPWQVVLACGEVLALAASVAGKSNKNLDSDVIVAVDMAIAGLNGSVANVEVNLKLIEDAAYVEDKRRAISEHLLAAEVKRKMVMLSLAMRA